MNDINRHQLLHGPYRAPRCRLGGKLRCLIRGEVVVRGLSAGPIPWPLTRAPRGGRPMLVLCGDLARAVRRESEVAVAHHWGVCESTVWLWRKALGVPRANEGSSHLWSKNLKEHLEDVQPRAVAKAQDPERRAKIAAAKRGKPRPPHVGQAVAAANRGKKASDETRQRMSEAHKRRGTRPPAAGKAWTAEEDALVRELSPAEAAARLGRPVQQVYDRRRALGMPDGRRRG